jgi:hypothetical protein
MDISHKGHFSIEQNYAGLLNLCPSLYKLHSSIKEARNNENGLQSTEISLAHQVCQEMFSSWNLSAPLFKSFSNVQNFCDRVVIFDDDDLEIRAHLFVAGATESTIHDHQHRFISICLQGSYTHKISIIRPTIERVSHYTQERQSGGTYSKVEQKDGTIRCILIQPFTAGQGLFLDPYATHSIEPVEGYPVVTIVFRDKVRVKSSSTLIWQDSSKPPPEQPITVIQDHTLRQDILKRLYRALENYQKIKKDAMIVTMPRTFLLIRLNAYLEEFIHRKNGVTTRDPIPRYIFTPQVLTGLMDLGVDKNRIELLRRVPEKYNEQNVLICVCRLAECCAFEDCKFCIPMLNILSDFDEHNTLNRKVWFAQTTEIEFSVYVGGSKIRDQNEAGSIVHRDSEVTCWYGPSCKWLKIGECRYKHDKTY